MTLTNSVLVLRVKGLFNSFLSPYTQFRCTAVTGNQLYPVLWEAVCRLETTGFRVIAFTCDGPTKGFSSCMAEKLEQSTRWKTCIQLTAGPSFLRSTTFDENCTYTWNPKDSCGLVIHTKCSGFNIFPLNYSEEWRGYFLSYLWKLYYANTLSDSPGLALLPKLKFEHVELTNYSNMRVDLAAQVCRWSIKIHILTCLHYYSGTK